MAYRGFHNKVYERVCRVCGTPFKTHTGNAAYCSDKCRHAGWKKIDSERKAEQKRLKGRDLLNATMMELREYNTLHGTSLSYGQYEAMMHSMETKGA